jgi:hypothetical protein
VPHAASTPLVCGTPVRREPRLVVCLRPFCRAGETTYARSIPNMARSRTVDQAAFRREAVIGSAFPRGLRRLLRGSDGRETKRMPRRVDQHAPAVVRLELGPPRSQSDRPSLMAIEVAIRRQVEMHHGRTRPGRRHVAVNSLHRQNSAANPQTDTSFRTPKLDAIEQGQVKVSERHRISAVQRDACDAKFWV